jgi:hypothetical protein
MNIPGLLIEYIINGIIAFFWIFLALFNIPEFSTFFENNSKTIVLFIIPLSYVVGMLIDGIALAMVKETKVYIKNKEITSKEVEKVYPCATTERLETLSKKKSLTDNLIIELNNKGKTQIVDEIKWRSSRDRIARGLIINSFLIGLMLTYTICNSGGSQAHCNCFCYFTGFILSLGTAGIFWFIWMGFEKMSFRFQVLAYLKVIDTPEPKLKKK